MKLFDKKNGKIAIWGWWQGHNLGDNWIKSCMRVIFPDADFIDTRVQDFKKYSFVICGGGGLWKDRPIPPFDKRIKTPFGVFGLGAEFPHVNNRALELLKQSDFFFVRDQHSLDCMGIDNIAPSRDITFSAPLQWIYDAESINLNKVFWVYRGGEDFIPYAHIPVWQKFIEYGHYVDNRNVFEKIIRNKFETIVADDFQTESDNAEERIGDCGFVISGRFHGIVMAIQKGLPCIAVDICPKIRALMNDAGLSDYILKMDEVDKLPGLIDRARSNIAEIRSKELSYRIEAVKIIEKDIGLAKLLARKHIGQTMRGIHYGAYWMGENDIVNAMSDDLADLCDLIKIDLKIYQKKYDKRIRKQEKTPNGLVNVLDTSRLIKDIKKYSPDFVFLNSAGITLDDEGFMYCKSHDVIVVGAAMSDPDVYPYNGALFARKFDVFYTNSKFSFKSQYSKGNIKLMPFAASVKHHFPIPNILKEYDIVIVGHARRDRLELVEKLKDFKLGLFGDGWGKAGRGSVHGLECVHAINSGKIYLSFAATNAGYQNIKIGLFEAMACNTCVIVSYMDELGDYFALGDEVLCYNDTDELIELLKKYMSDDSARERVRVRGFMRFLREHTYHRRFVNMLEDISSLKQNYTAVTPSRGPSASVPAGQFEGAARETAEEWLRTCTFDGLAHSYDTVSGKWTKPYPEVTGYVLAYMCRNNYDPRKCLEMGAELLRLQRKNGGFPSFFDTHILWPFDTSQILVGFAELYKKSGDRRFYNAAVLCGDFLISSQQDNGGFIPIYDSKESEWIINRNTYAPWNGPWSSLMCKLTEGYAALHEITGDKNWERRVCRTVSFYKNQPDMDYTHPQAYFLEGLLAGGEVDLVREKLRNLVLPRVRENGFIPYAEDLPYAYVSGTIQMGVLFAKTGSLDVAGKIREYGRLVQSKGGLGGLFQYAGENGDLDNHVHTEMNSWGTKYFCELERILEHDME